MAQRRGAGSDYNRGVWLPKAVVTSLNPPIVVQAEVSEAVNASFYSTVPDGPGTWMTAAMRKWFA